MKGIAKPKPRAAQCGAQTKSGGICRNPPAHGSNRCRFHGGASPQGIASASYKHGLYSIIWGKMVADIELRLLLDKISPLEAAEEQWKIARIRFVQAAKAFVADDLTTEIGERHAKLWTTIQAEYRQACRLYLEAVSMYDIPQEKKDMIELRINGLDLNALMGSQNPSKAKALNEPAPAFPDGHLPH